MIELDLKIIWSINTVDIGTKNYSFAQVSTKEIYNNVRNRKDVGRKIMDYWIEKRNFSFSEIQTRFKLNVSKFIEGNARNIHFGLIFRFLHTRSRQAYMFPNSDPNCKFCLNRGVTARETVVHCFLYCSRVSAFCLKIENFLK